LQNPRVEKPPEVEDITNKHDNDTDQDTEEEIQNETTGPSKKKTNPTVTVAHTKAGFVVIAPNLESVIVVEDMLGFVPKLRYADHNVTEVAKFLEILHRKFIWRERERAH
jgi:hypothetical protein